MKTLEQEASKAHEDFYNGEITSVIDVFIAGANSKWVQAEKIKAQIELLKSIPEDSETALWILAKKQLDLEEQLKQLEDEE